MSKVAKIAELLMLNKLILRTKITAGKDNNDNLTEKRPYYKEFQRLSKVHSNKVINSA